MEAGVRKPFQGVTNVIRFNWHFYVIAGFAVAFLFLSLLFISTDYNWIAGIFGIILLLTTFLSLIISYYVYDYSGFYNFEWLGYLNIGAKCKIVNIHAGFDETSKIFNTKFTNIDLQVFDFYDPDKHTEVSIKRARKAYAAFPGTKPIRTDLIPVERNSIDVIFNVFSIHEVRCSEERINFLKKQNEVLKNNGCCIVVEHLRDLSNFIAYNIGFFHFFSLHEWKSNFFAAGFEIERIIKITPFVSVFMLKKNNGDTR